MHGGRFPELDHTVAAGAAIGLASLNHHERVIPLGSLGKSISPALRLDFITAAQGWQIRLPRTVDSLYRLAAGQGRPPGCIAWNSIDSPRSSCVGARTDSPDKPW